MGSALFYHLTRSAAEQLLPVLIGKSRAAGWRVELRGTDAGRMARLDEALWQGEGFLPHGLAGGPHDALKRNPQEYVRALIAHRRDREDQILARLKAGDELIHDMVEVMYAAVDKRLHPAAAHATRIPSGHPEGYLEAFAQLYRDAAEQITARREGRAPDPLACDTPTVEDGLRGMRFVAAAVASSRAGGVWTDV